MKKMTMVIVVITTLVLSVGVTAAENEPVISLSKTRGKLPASNEAKLKYQGGK